MTLIKINNLVNNKELNELKIKNNLKYIGSLILKNQGFKFISGDILFESYSAVITFVNKYSNRKEIEKIPEIKCFFFGL